MNDLPSFRMADYVLGWTTPEKCGLAAVCDECGSRSVRHPAIHACTSQRHQCNARGWAQVPSNADVSSRMSLDIAGEMLGVLHITKSQPWQPRQSTALGFEKAVAHFASADDLTVRQNAHLSQFAQYRHLRDRRDDRLRLDITVSRGDKLLAVLELKTTIRSDRARGAIRNLTSTLTQHGGSDVPIAAVVTAEPLPGRLAAVTPRTGDTHLVYHVARTALARAVETVPCGSQLAEWRTTETHVHDLGELFTALRRTAS